MAEVEDEIGLLFRPGGVAGRKLAVGAVLGFVVGGHGVTVRGVVFGVHFRRRGGGVGGGLVDGVLRLGCCEWKG